ncbi:MAG: hypothetical protein CM15mP74_24830 [Halieaceae bacterium]|nr:MAG: hypothetical protein CM15mP74_24830 [Halieaceae bacterium]
MLGVIGLANWQFNPFTPMTPPDTDLLGADGALIVGLSIGMWFYSGYESMSTLAGEIEEPQRIIPKALMLALPFVAFMYLLPTLASLAAFGNGSCSRSMAQTAPCLSLISDVHWVAQRSVTRCWRRWSWATSRLSGLHGLRCRPLQKLAADGLLPKPLPSSIVALVHP